MFDSHGGCVVSDGRRLLQVAFEGVVEFDRLGRRQVLADLGDPDSLRIEEPEPVLVKKFGPPLERSVLDDQVLGPIHFWIKRIFSFETSSNQLKDIFVDLPSHTFKQ